MQKRWLTQALLATLCAVGVFAYARSNTPSDEIATAALPPEARQTLQLIDQGGPYPYRKDGVVFQNRERRLPQRERGCYREYTVPTPGSKDRGARRIVTSCDGPRYYTADHYRSFKRIRP